MKILLGNNYFSPIGGAEMVLYWQYLLLKEKEHEVFIFATNKEPFFEAENLHTEYFPRCVDYSNLHGFNKILHIPKRFYNIEAEKKLDALVKKTKPDIAHFGNIRSNLTPAILKSCYKNNIPMVITLHDSSLFCPNGVLITNSGEYCKKELCIKGNHLHCILNKCRGNSYSKSTNAVCELALNKMHKLYDKVNAFVTPSQALKKLAVKSGICEDRITVIPNFVDDSYLKSMVNIGKGGYFLYVGTISRIKGLDYLINAFSYLPSEIKLRIVGTGPDRENLQLLANKLNLNNIEFVGFKSGDELLKEYQNCIATILPSNCFDNFPTTILESFASGKPVIGSNLGGIPETVKTNATGILVEPGCVEDIVDAIKKMYNDEPFLKELSINCKEESKKYSREIYYSKLMELYDNIMKDRRSL